MGNINLNEENSYTFSFIPDGTFRTYKINLSKVKNYNGLLNYLAIKPILKGEDGASVKIKRIWFSK